MSRRGNWYDTAQICTNGHAITSFGETYPENLMNFCKDCGNPTITQCKNCSANIRGYYHMENVGSLLGYVVPSFCYNCGKPYPWTETRLDEAKKLTNTLNISSAEKQILVDSIDDIVKNTPRKESAIQKFKAITANIPPEAKDTLKQILIGVVTDGIKKALGWG